MFFQNRVCSDKICQKLVFISFSLKNKGKRPFWTISTWNWPGGWATPNRAQFGPTIVQNWAKLGPNVGKTVKKKGCAWNRPELPGIARRFRPEFAQIEWNLWISNAFRRFFVFSSVFFIEKYVFWCIFHVFVAFLCFWDDICVFLRFQGKLASVVFFDPRGIFQENFCSRNV